MVLEWDPHPEQRGGPVLLLPLPEVQPLLQEGGLQDHAEGPPAGPPRQRSPAAADLPQGVSAHTLAAKPMLLLMNGIQSA